LELFAAGGERLSQNFYWLSTKPDELDFAKTEWYYTPQTSFADFSTLQDLPKATVRATFRAAAGNEHDATFHVVIENTGKSVAFLTRLRLVKGKEKSEILPVYWSDNYISLLPGEKRELTVHVRRSDLGKSDLAGAQPNLVVDGFNVTAVTKPISNN
jgi:exo-1,4-beta-D-glucosaminidase